MTTTSSELRQAAQALLARLDDMTTLEFSRGGERVEREALRAALEAPVAGPDPALTPAERESAAERTLVTLRQSQAKASADLRAMHGQLEDARLQLVVLGRQLDQVLASLAKVAPPARQTAQVSDGR
jgi:hypothetical protein